MGLVTAGLLNYKPHVLLAEEEDTSVKGNSRSVSRYVDRKKTVQKWKEGIEVNISCPWQQHTLVTTG